MALIHTEAEKKLNSVHPENLHTFIVICFVVFHYNDVIMSTMASQITSLTIVYSTIYSGADQRKYQSSASLAFVRGIHRSPVNSPHKGPGCDSHIHGWPSTQPGSLHTALQRKYTQPCLLFSRGAAVWTMEARLCEQWGTAVCKCPAV